MSGPFFWGREQSVILGPGSLTELEMDIQTLISFFMWCTIINGGMMIVAGLMFLTIPEFIYRIHSRWIDISRETFNAVMYATLAFFKAIFILFNLVPWLVVLIIR